MRIIVMGVGPVGGIIGGRLAYAGNQVTFVDINPEHVGAIREHGLSVDVPDRPFKVSVPTLFPAEIKETFDLAFIAVRSNGTSQVLSTLEPHLNQNAILVSLQNGINPPLLEALVGPNHAIGTLIRMGCRCIGPGQVKTLVRGKLFVGHLHGRTTPQLNAVQTLLNSVIPTQITGNILGSLWSKLTFTCLRMFESLTDVTLTALWQSEPNRRLSVAFMAEIVAVGAATGVRFEPLKEYNPPDFHPSRPHKIRLSMFTQMTKNWKSGGPDWKSGDPGGTVNQLKQGLKTEVDFTVGHVVREGERVGVRTPICRKLVELIHEIEDGTRPLQPENFADLTAAAPR